MAKRRPGHLLKKLSRAIELHLGLSYPEDRLDDLRRAVSRASLRSGSNDPDMGLEWLLEPLHIVDRIESLADYLTVGETYFFRDEKLFNTFGREILPELIKNSRETGKRLKIWSAGCASGEEPYSVAIVVSQALADLTDLNVSILATDINQRFLRKCKVGVYGQWSFRDTRPEITETYFQKTPVGYEIIPEIRKMVRFERLNLVRDPYPDPFTDTEEMDVIFCRNVLMYFSTKRQREVLERFNRCLSNDGWLVVSPAEASLVDHTLFEQISRPGVVLFKKKRQQTADEKSYSSEQFEPDLKQALLAGSTTIEFPQEIHSVIPSIHEREPLEPAHRTLDHDTQVEEDPCKAGLDLFENGKYAEAVIHLQQALEKNRARGDNCTGAMSALARAYANLGMLDQALEWCEKTSQADKLNPEYHFLQATILEEMGDLDRAQISLDRALFLDPDLVVARFAMGNLARRQGRLSVSYRHYKIALEVLSGYDETETLPGSDNLTAGRLVEAIQATMVREMGYEQS